MPASYSTSAPTVRPLTPRASQKPVNPNSPCRIRLASLFQKKLLLLSCILLSSAPLSFSSCLCGFSDPKYTILDADCLDQILCLQCQPCTITCCAGTSHWAQAGQSLPWGNLRGFSLLTFPWNEHTSSVLIMGGEFENGTKTSRVWESLDARNWELRSFAEVWGPRSDFGAVLWAAQARIFVFGGEGSDELKDDVWEWRRDVRSGFYHATSSQSWKRIVVGAQWGPRKGMGAALLSWSVNTSGIVLIAGSSKEVMQFPKNITRPAEGNSSNTETQTIFETREFDRYHGDVWTTVDGIVWEQSIQEMPWLMRKEFEVLVHPNEAGLPGVYVLGGQGVERGEMHHDIWRSTDGVSWDRVRLHPDFSPRSAFGAVSDGKQLIVSGGVLDSGHKEGDIWQSIRHCHAASGCNRAGDEWVNQLPGTVDAAWGPRSHHKLARMNSSIVLVGGRVTDPAYSHPDGRPVSDVWITQQRCRKGHVGFSCQKCPKGSFSEDEGFLPDEDCELCEKGTFAEDEGQDSCKPCLPGSFAARKGQTECDPCTPGHVTADSGQSACVPCPPGQVQRQEGQSTCGPCPARYYCPLATAIPMGCPQGSTTEAGEGEELNDCICLPGHFSPLGHTPCQRCNYGYYAASPASLQCTKCPEGTNTTEKGSRHPSDCAKVEPVEDGDGAHNVEIADSMVQLRLPIEVSVLNSSRKELLQAVAAAADVAGDKVELIDLTGGVSIDGAYSTAVIIITVEAGEIAAKMKHDVSDLGRLNLALQAVGLPEVLRFRLGTEPLPEEPRPTTPVPGTNDTSAGDLVEGGSDQMSSILFLLFLIAVSVCGCTILMKRWCFGPSQGSPSRGDTRRRIGEKIAKKVQMKKLPRVFRTSSNTMAESKALTAPDIDDADL